MAKKTNQNRKDLGYLGVENQFKIVKALIEDKHFFLSVYEVLDQNAFSGSESAKLREIVGTMKDQFKKNSNVPNYATIELALRENSKDDIDLEESLQTLERLKSQQLYDGQEMAKEIAMKFFRQQKLIKVCNKAIENVGNNGFGDGEVLASLQDSLTSISREQNVDDNRDIFSMMDDVLAMREGDKVNFGITELDKAMNGGMQKGQLALLIAKTGAGKTTLATIIANHSARCGKKVMQISFEEKTVEIANKHYAVMSKMYTNQINTASKEQLIGAMDVEIKDKVRDNLRIVQMPTESTQVEDIKNKILNYRINYGFNPDLIIIDYFSCLQKSSNKNVEYSNEWKAAENAMRKLERMATELNVAFLITEQTNRDGAKADTADNRIGNIQGSYRATQPCSFIFYLDRTNCEMNKANLYMDKSRNCEPKKWENFYLNNGNLQMDLGEQSNLDINLSWAEEELTPAQKMFKLLR